MTEKRIGKEHYDSSEYFEGRGTAHLTDTESPFQRYRIEKVTAIHPPMPGDRVVDLGCGWGTFGFALAVTAPRSLRADRGIAAISVRDRCNFGRRLMPEPAAG